MNFRTMPRTALLLTSGVTALLLSGCAVPSAARPTASAPPAEVARVAPPSPAASLPAPLAAALDYADRVRGLAPAELPAEVARLSLLSEPLAQLQLTLALLQLRQLPELLRAQDTLVRLLGNQEAAAQALHPLARLLAARLAEQRRLEDLLDKQNQQTRELQRRLDQTNERLEALKAIERSLGSRSAPAGRNAGPSP